MNNHTISRFISNDRLNNYTDFNEYKNNIYLSQKYYILLSIFEVSFRNSLDYYLKSISNNYLLEESILHTDSIVKIKEAKKKILQRKEQLSHNKIVAELSFGFWTSLFRKSYSNIMRTNHIKTIFPNIPKKDVKLINRNILDKKLNKIRKFRNRIFHFEKIINKQEYKNIENEILELLNYFDNSLFTFANDFV